MNEIATSKSSAAGAEAGAALAGFWQTAVKPYYLVPVAIFLIVSAMLLGFKEIKIDQFRGDTAIFSQVTENIASRGAAVSQVFENTQSYLESGLLTMPADQMAKDPLSPPQAAERNMLRFHAYFILYPIALFAKFIPARLLLLTLYVLSFTGLILAAYFILRGKGLPVAAAVLFCLLVISHPGWGEGMLWGQFYPDRLFILIGFAFMFFVSRKHTPLWLQGLAALGCLLVGERAGITAGMFLLAYSALNWKSLEKSERNSKLAIGAVLFICGFLLLKLFVSNSNYSHFMPTNLAQVMANLHYPGFMLKIALCLLINLPLLAIAFFEWRAGLIAVLLLLPNLLGNIGGAEKIGWITHYDSYYLPALVWAALRGYERAYGMAIAKTMPAAFYAVSAALILLVSMVGPSSFAPISIAPGNIANNFLIAFPQQAKTYLTPAGLAYRALGDQIAAMVPEHSTVSTSESLMPFLYENRTIRFIPVDIDHADYAAVSFTRSGNQIKLGGVVTSFLGPRESQKINDMIIARMRKDGYDLAHPQLVPAFGLAIVKRIH